MNKLVKAVSVAALSIIAITACEPPKDPGKAGPAKKITIWSDGDHKIGVRNSFKTIRALNPSSGCKWTLMYDLPNGKVVVVASGGTKSAKTGVKLKGPGTLRYKDPKTGKMVTKKDRPTSFYSENCNTWTEK